MKLYYAPQSCALAPHIVAVEAGLPIDAISVDIPTLRTASGRDYLTLNPKGFVPALELDDGQVLTENAAVLQYLADLKPEAGLAPPPGTWARTRLHEALHYLGTDIHRGYSPLFRGDTPAQTREERRASLRRHYAVLDVQLSRSPFLLGDRYGVADAYLFVLTRWAELVRLDLSEFAHLRAFQDGIAARPAVRSAMRAQGLIGE
jgi:glutathione S-transferase